MLESEYIDVSNLKSIRTIKDILRCEVGIEHKDKLMFYLTKNEMRLEEKIKVVGEDDT